MDHLKSKAPLASWIDKKIKLTRKGKLLLGNCPFHQEKSASFTVYEAQDTFHCFGCGAHGDIIKFIMMSDHMSFREAVQKLAETVGVRLPEEQSAAHEINHNRRVLIQATEAATVFYQNQLHANVGRAARAYLAERLIPEREWSRFRLGYAPSGNALKTYLLKEGYEEKVLLEAGLILDSTGRKEGSFDYFRDRLIFPILSRQEKPVAFGGRLLKEGHPKYLNSHETSLFIKGQTLYGLSEALKSYKSDEPVYIVEGYLDVIRLFERGYRAVAPLGTAMTVEQMQLLWKSIAEPYVLFDGDAAGRDATFKLAHRILPFLRPGCSLFALSLPNGEDPDSFLAGNDASLLNEMKKSARPLSQYVFEEHLRRNPVRTPEQQAALDEYLKSLVTSIKDQSVQKYYESFFREKLFALRQQIKRNPRQPQQGNQKQDVGPAPTSNTVPHAVVRLKNHVQDSLRQRILVATLLNHPDILHDVDQAFADLHFKDKKFDQLRDEIFLVMNEKKDLDIESMHAHLKKSGFGELMQKILSKDIYIHASFAHPKEEKEKARLGWLEIWRHMVEEKMVRADINQLKSQLSEDLSEETWLKLRVLKNSKLKETPH